MDFPWPENSLPSFEQVMGFLKSEFNKTHGIAFEKHVFQYWNEEYIDCLAKEIISRIGNGPVLEICAGNGTLTHWLREKGVNIIATDDDSWGKGKLENGIPHIFPVLRMEAKAAIRHYNPKMVIASWLPYDEPLDTEILQLDVPMIIVIGEGHGGCTGTEDFWMKDFGYDREYLDSCDNWNLCRTDWVMSNERDIFKHSCTVLMVKR